LKKLRKHNISKFSEILRYIYEKFYLVIYKIIFQKKYLDSKNASEGIDGIYIKVLKRAIYEENFFKNFKRNPVYRRMLEHITYRQGLEYIYEIKKNNLEILNSLDKFIINDNTGNPIKFYYKDLALSISPTTLSYLKVLCDIKNNFGERFKNIIELGCGYGGQYIILDKGLRIENYTLFDLPEVNLLIKKNLINFNLSSEYNIGNLENNYQDIDLLISNYAFSEFPVNLQRKFLKKIIMKCKHGYMIMNSGLDISDLKTKQSEENLPEEYKNHLSFSEIKKIIPTCRIIDEIPLTGKGNYIIIW